MVVTLHNNIKLFGDPVYLHVEGASLVSCQKSKQPDVPAMTCTCDSPKSFKKSSKLRLPQTQQAEDRRGSVSAPDRRSLFGPLFRLTRWKRRRSRKDLSCDVIRPLSREFVRLWWDNSSASSEEADSDPAVINVTPRRLPGPLNMPDCPVFDHATPCPVPGTADLTQLAHMQGVTVYKFPRPCFTPALGNSCNALYHVINHKGQLVYTAEETSSVCSRWCCGGHRTLQLILLDNDGVEVLTMDRPSTCCADVTTFLTDRSRDVTLYSQGRLLGFIKQPNRWYGLHLEIRRERLGPALYDVIGYEGDSYQVFEKLGTGRRLVGHICGQWSSQSSVMYWGFYSSYLGLTFPLELMVDLKALLLGVAFLLYVLRYDHK
ncbi:phospholipid scramblase 2 [Aplysia californica]|uniref:Phospholipid scramblase n=1 Tax=Aplysia californica TaxID=6500 RepID=A0ABM1W093_APLCA|nr:phospholipid scramblase 2 [Aplysia californica]